MVHEYEMTQRILRHLQSRQKVDRVLCAVCQQPIRIGESTVSRSRKQKWVVYHRGCFESLFITA